MSADMSVTAHFVQITHDLTIVVDPVDGGTTSPPVGVHTYAEGTIVEITASPAAGYVFDHWSGACSGIGACSVTMSADMSVTAHFVLFNTPPVAVDDSSATVEAIPVVISVLSNDTDGEGNSLIVAWVGLPAHGTAVISPDGLTILYTPVAGYTGIDTFTYKANDGFADSNEATVTINVLPDLIFADGFESGNLVPWRDAVTDGGDLSVTSGAALIGSYGLQAFIDDNTGIYLGDDSPNAEARYRARFYFDPNSITMANYDAHHIFYGYSASSHILVVEFRIANGVYQVRILTLTDSGAWRISSFFAISDASHFIEFDWQAATAPGANDGSLTFWIDGVERSSLVAIDNDTRRIDSIRLGPIAAIDTGTRGTYLFDAFESRRQVYIGPVP